MTIKIILIDESQIFRAGLKKNLIDEKIIIVGEAGNGVQGQYLIRQKQPDIVLLDLALPDTTGIQVCDFIQQHFPKIKTLFLINYSELSTLNRLIGTSAKGILTKRSHYPLIEAIKTVHNGGHYLQPDIAWELLNFREKNKNNQEIPLTDREYQVLTLIGRGKTYEEISEMIHISLKTVYNLKSSGLKKINCKIPEKTML